MTMSTLGPRSGFSPSSDDDSCSNCPSPKRTTTSRFPYLEPPLPPCPRCGVELNVRDWVSGLHAAGCGERIPLSTYDRS